MYKRLKDVPPLVLAQALDDLIAEEKFFPKYKEIFGAVMRVMNVKGLRFETRPSAIPATMCRLCGDSGIKMRQHRRDVVTDFYCHCETAMALTQHDWSDPVWAATITGHENLPTAKGKTTHRMKALAKAARSLRPKIIDMASSEPIDLGDIPF